MCARSLPRDLGEAIHPARLAKFAREGAVAPLTLLNDFGERRRVASLAAQMSELECAVRGFVGGRRRRTGSVGLDSHP